MKISSNNLSGQLKKSLLPCYFVSGDEPLLVQEALDSIRQTAHENGFTSRDLFFQTQGFDWNEIFESSRNLSLFSEKRIIELRLTTGRPGREGSAAIIDIIEQIDDDLLFLISSPKLDKQSLSSKWVKSLESSGCRVEVWPVNIKDLPKWIELRMKKYDFLPDSDSIKLISSRVEGNLLAANQEIEKLALQLEKGRITEEDIRRTIVDSSRFDVYKLLDAVLEGDSRRSLKILNGLKQEGIEVLVILWALARELRVLIKIAVGFESGENINSLMNKIGVWRNRQNLVRTCINRHKSSEFYYLIQSIFYADSVAKGQLIGDKWQYTTNIIVQLSGRSCDAK
mgnify:FL=1